LNRCWGGGFDRAVGPVPDAPRAGAYLAILSAYMAHFPVICLFNETMRNVPMYGKHLLAFVCLQLLCALGAGILTAAAWEMVGAIGPRAADAAQGNKITPCRI